MSPNFDAIFLKVLWFRIINFEEGPHDLAGDTPARPVRLSGLFSKPNRPLVIYHFMFGKRQTKPCPMCTAWLDGANGVAHHLVQNLEFAVVAAADLPTLRAHARARGWDKLRLLSAGNSTFKYDLGSEDPEGGQDSTVSVFTQDSNGNLRHFYTAHPRMAPDIQERGYSESIVVDAPIYRAWARLLRTSRVESQLEFKRTNCPASSRGGCF